MQQNNKSVFIANNLSDILYHLKSVSGLQILGGCTAIEEMKEKSVTVLPIKELAEYDKKERYIDLGSAITLSRLLDLGRQNLPTVLYDAVTTIATQSVRNIATLGGNICASGIKHTLYSPLLALDAKLEFKNYSETKNIPFSSFSEVPEGFVLTNVRVPVRDWEVSIFKRVGPNSKITPLSAGFTFLLSTQNNVIVNVKVSYAGLVVFHSHELENRMIGTRLPLSQRTIADITKTAGSLYDKIENVQNSPLILKAQFINLLRYSLEQLT